MMANVNIIIPTISNDSLSLVSGEYQKNSYKAHKSQQLI